MSVRRVPALLVVAVLALGPTAAAQAQNAGDEQYSDPLAGETSPSSATPPVTQTPSTTKSKSTGSGSSPNGSGTASGSGTVAATATTTTPASSSPGTTATASARELPRTGLDAWAIAVLGAALLLLGIGLRLRTADARP